MQFCLKICGDFGVNCVFSNGPLIGLNSKSYASRLTTYISFILIRLSTLRPLLHINSHLIPYFGSMFPWTIFVIIQRDLYFIQYFIFNSSSFLLRLISQTEINIILEPIASSALLKIKLGCYRRWNYMCTSFYWRCDVVLAKKDHQRRRRQHNLY